MGTFFLHIAPIVNSTLLVIVLWRLLWAGAPMNRGWRKYLAKVFRMNPKPSFETLDERMNNLEDLVRNKFLNCPVCLEHAAIAGGRRAADEAQRLVFAETQKGDQAIKSLTQNVEDLSSKVKALTEAVDVALALLGKKLNHKTGKVEHQTP